MRGEKQETVSGDVGVKSVACIKMGTFLAIKRFIRTIKFHGGLKRAFLQLLYTDTLKVGYLVGEDAYGNKYYENSYYFFPTNRWVVYPRKAGFDYDATMIEPEYFAWIHHMTDVLPCMDESRTVHPWQLPHTHNLTGTEFEYVPYSTVNPKIHAWKPPKVPCPPPQPIVLPSCRKMVEERQKAAECE